MYYNTISSIVLEIKTKEDHRLDFSLSIELLSAYTTEKNLFG